MHTDKRIRAGLISVGCDILLVCIKLMGAWLSMSMAMKADAIHSFSDIGVSGLVLAGALLSRFKFPWLKTLENVIALFIALLILAAALTLGMQTVQYRNQPLSNVPVTIGLVWVCILISYGISRYKIQVGREVNSPSLEADGYHSRMDMYSSVAVLVGLLANWTGMRLDAIASFVVVLLIAKIGLELLISSIQGMLQSEVLTFETVQVLSAAARKDKEGEGEGSPNTAMQEELIRWARSCTGFLWAWRKPLYLSTALLAIVLYGGSGFYRIQPNETGIVLRFGEWDGQEMAPGLHYRWPYPMTKLQRVKPQEVNRIEVGFRTKGVRGQVIEPAAYLWETMHQSGIYERPLEAVMLTGDKNEVDVNFVVEYRIQDKAVHQYLFHLANSEDLVRASAESCSRRVIGSMALTAVLTTDRYIVEQRIHECLQKILDGYDAGVLVTAIRLQDIHPPIEVVQAFRRVATAREDKITQVNKAVAFQLENIPKARGGAKYIQADADAYRLEKELRAEGDVAYFKAMSQTFEAAPEAISFLMYMDALEEVMPALRKVLYSPESARKASRNTVQNYFLAGELFKKSLTDYSPS